MKKKLLKRLYEKWVRDASDAHYYGTAYDATSDFKKLFKALKYKYKK